MGDPPGGGGGAAELKHLTSYAEPNPLEIGTGNWAAADKVVREIIRKVQPTSVSEERRKEVVHYVQRLIRNCLGAEVFPYGSVPLKTYLPDGDIDLTAFGGANLEDTLADDMKSVLEEKEKNTAPEFVVKDVQLIRAEVKLVKCIVQDIVVDISFNQIGGLCTLCFLEQVDRLIAKDHLFKRSIILIKAWCYYESRILGAHHGLISTYALETLVLYIFHLYHSTLDGPLAVLYKFLDYFSKFDWETYCISLNGPIRLSSLPTIVAEMPEDSDRNLLLSRDFLSSCVSMFSVPSRGGEKNSRGFQRKHLNIIDPLKEINNLGRSVSKGNYYRIRSAFSYGARKLARILLQPQDSIANELHKFFANSMARQGGGQRLDVLDFDQSLIHNRPISAVPIQEAGLCKTDNFDEYFAEYAKSNGDVLSSSGKSSQDSFKAIERTSNTENREQFSSFPSKQLEANHPGTQFFGVSDDLPTSGLEGLTISTDSSKCQTSSPNERVCVVPTPCFAPHLFFSKSKWHDNSKRDGSLGSDKLDRSKNNASSLVFEGSNEGEFATVESIHENQLVDRDEVGASSQTRDVFQDQKAFPFSGDLSHVDLDQGPASRNGAPETLNSSDLTGDYESYLQYLHRGRWCYEYGLGIHSLATPPYQSNSLWDSLLPLSHYKQNGFSHQHQNGFHPSPAVYALSPVLVQGVSYGWEDVPKPRGTGTYFPNTNLPLQGYRSSALKGRNQAPTRSPRSNGRNMISTTEPNMLDRKSHEPPQHQVPVDNTAMVSPSDSYLPFSPNQNGYPNANGLFIQPEGVVEFEENSRPQKTVSSSPRTISGMQNSQTALSEEPDRISLSSSYHLKDEDDFPPLSM